MIELVDTHCHIHFSDYPLDVDEVLAAARQDGVTRLIAVGCRLEDSKGAVDIAARHSGIWASVGLHPHEASRYIHDHGALQQFRELASKPKVVAVGEIGLDYYYRHSEPDEQKQMLRFQLDVAVQNNVPVIFHIRDAFDDFWPIYDEYVQSGTKIKGVVHSFSASRLELEQILERDLYVGLNGIMTFTKNPEQLAAARAVPLDKLVLETDAPFLTPTPYRGKVCEPKHVGVTAAFLAELRHEDLNTLARRTTENAKLLFSL